MTDGETYISQHLDRILLAPADGLGMDIIVVSTTSAAQAEYWQSRLDAVQGQVTGRDTTAVAVHEDWPGGAGNGLGTLYAVIKGADACRQRFGIDLLGRLDAGAAVAVYHTAGQGTRLAPLPGSENNNKAAVKLPGLVNIDGDPAPITVLESVIKQTATYAPSRRGRLSVFWGDQIFVPSAPVDYRPTHHVDILARLQPMPDEESWRKRDLESYGLIAVDDAGDAAQVEKVDYLTARGLIDQGRIGVGGGIGVSLGSFSLSAAAVHGLLDEFASELDTRVGKLDTDPHFWMPVTLDEETYTDIMKRKGTEPGEIATHYARMQGWKNNLLDAHPSHRVFGAVDVGQDAYWWDFGQIGGYREHLMQLTASGHEADSMRRFFGISERRSESQLGDQVDADDASCIIGSRVNRGRIRNSVLIDVVADSLEVKDCVLIRVSASEVAGEGCLVYNIAHSDYLKLQPCAVVADTFLPDQPAIRMGTAFGRDGKTDWDTVIEGNPMSYADVHRLNRHVDISAADDTARAAHRLQRDAC